MAVKRGIVAFGCAVLFAAAPLVVAAPAAACPWGTSERFPGVCTKGGAGVSGNPVVVPQASAPGPVISQSPQGIGSVNGIPCTPEHYSTCIAMTQAG